MGFPGTARAEGVGRGGDCQVPLSLPLAKKNDGVENRQRRERVLGSQSGVDSDPACKGVANPRGRADVRYI